MTQMNRRSGTRKKAVGRKARIADVMSPRLFKALCDPNRIAILARLSECRDARTVTQVAGCCPVDLSVVSRHLALLRDAGVVESEKRGKKVYYRVCGPFLVVTLRGMADTIAACCSPRPSGRARTAATRKTATRKTSARKAIARPAARGGGRRRRS